MLLILFKVAFIRRLITKRLRGNFNTYRQMQYIILYRDGYLKCIGFNI